jgi:hypothetical protein
MSEEKEWKDCPRCDGFGKVSLGDGWALCPKCKGERTIEEDAAIDKMVSRLLDEDEGEQTMLAAVDLLKDLGASYEYPGWINIVAGGFEFAFGDLNGPWTGHYGPPDDPGENGFDEELPPTATAQELADFIRRSVTSALGSQIPPVS